jgi:hypothetical protein
MTDDLGNLLRSKEEKYNIFLKERYKVAEYQSKLWVFNNKYVVVELGSDDFEIWQAIK